MGAVLTRAARPEEALAELDRIVATLDLPVISGGDWE